VHNIVKKLVFGERYIPFLVLNREERSDLGIVELRFRVEQLIEIIKTLSFAWNLQLAGVDWKLKVIEDGVFH